jgi:hypothetical protein
VPVGSSILLKHNTRSILLNSFAYRDLFRAASFKSAHDVVSVEYRSRLLDCDASRLRVRMFAARGPAKIVEQLADRHEAAST